MRRARNLAAGMVVAAICTGFAGAAPAQAAGAAPVPAEVVGSRQVEQSLGQLKASGASDTEIKGKLGLVRVDQATGTRSLLSTNSAVSLTTPSVYYDTGARTYYASGSWNFSTYPDFSQSRGDQAIGGLDGFGMRFSRQVQSSGGTLQVCPKSTGGTARYSCFAATNYWTNDATGTTWKFQDRVFSDPLVTQMNFGRGTITKAFKPITTGCTQIGTSYAHSWGGSAVNGFGVSTTGFNVSWTDASKGWQRASALGTFGC